VVLTATPVTVAAVPTAAPVTVITVQLAVREVEAISSRDRKFFMLGGKF